MAGPIRIAILANGSQAKREFASLSGQANKFGSQFARFGKVAAAGVAVAGVAVGKLAVDSIKSASDAQQSLGATEQIFGKYADTVVKRSRDAARALGLSANEYRELSNQTGAMLANTGMPMQKVTDLTDKLNRRAADMAATFGGTTRDAVEAVSSLMRGEADPIERYGVSIKQSDVNARLAAQGLDKLEGSAKKQAEQQARLDLLFSQSAKTAGQFGRESNTLAGQQQRLSAQFENLKAKIGTALLPVATAVVSFIASTALPAFERWGSALRDNLAPVLDTVRTGLSNLMTSLAPVGAWLSAHPEVIKGVAVGLGVAAVAAIAFAAAMGVVALVTSPVTLVVAALAALGGAVAYAWKNSETFRTVVTNVGAALRSGLGAALQWVSAQWRAWSPLILEVLAVVGSAIRGFIGYAAPAFRAGFSAILNVTRAVFGAIGGYVNGVMRALRGVINVVLGVIKGDWGRVIRGLQQVASGVFSAIRSLVSGAMGAIRAAISGGMSAARAAWSGAWSAMRSLVAAAWTRIKGAVSTGISAMMGLITSIPGRITGALSGLGGLLYSAGSSIIQGLINGIESKISAVRSKLSSLTNMIPNWKGPKRKDERLLRPVGRIIIAGLIKGFDDGESGVKKALGRITDLIEKRIVGKNEQARERRLFRRYADEYRALMKNAKAQDKINKKLDDARTKVADLVKARDDYAQSIKDSVTNFGGIVGLGKNEDDGTVSITGLIDQLKNKVNEAKRFSSLILDLTKQGLSQANIQQLLSAGPEAALATAEAIKFGGASAITQLNDLTKDLAATGSTLGTTMAATFHNAGIRAAQGIVSGLEKEAKRLDRAASRLATSLVKSVKRALGIRSPSRVFQSIGDQTVKGLSIGLDDVYVKRQGAQLAASLEKGFATPALNAYMSTATSSNSQTITLDLRLTADQISDIEAGRRITVKQDAYLAAGGRRFA